MRVLQLCNKPPSGSDGGALAISAVTAGLLDAGNEVTVLAIETAKHPLTEKQFRAGGNKTVDVKAVFVDTRVKTLPALGNFFNSRSYNIDRFYSAAFEAALAETLQQQPFDIIHLESLYMTPYLEVIRKHSKAPVVLRAHNVEYLLWQRQAEVAGSALKKNYFRFLASRLEQYEKTAIQKVDGIACITPEDETLFRKLAPAVPVCCIPYALPLPEKTAAAPKTNTVFHIGAMDWQPNIDGVNWLLDNVWPLVIAKQPDAELHLAGRNMDERWQAKKTTGVFFHGEVPDATVFMNDYSILAVPLLSGGGMRVKVAEAMALGKAIVSTATGAEGIAATNGTHLQLADTPAAFADQLLELLQHPEKAMMLGEAARHFAAENFGRTRITGKLLDFYSRLLADQS